MQGEMLISLKIIYVHLVGSYRRSGKLGLYHNPPALRKGVATEKFRNKRSYLLWLYPPEYVVPERFDTAKETELDGGKPPIVLQFSFQ